MSDLAARKLAARKSALARRRQAFELAGASSNQLSTVLEHYRGVPLAGYMPMRSEIDPLPAMAEAVAHGPVGVPVISGEAQPLDFHRWNPDAEMVDGAFGAQIPRQAEPMVPHVLIVPLVAFDLNGGRLGYGGGFYDRTLEMLRSSGPTVAIGFAFDAQEAEALPLEATDQPLDLLVTESRIIEFTHRDKAQV